MKRNQYKLPYIPPDLEVFDYVVEKGFAYTETHGVTSGSQDQWSEINDYSELGHSGENQTGQWSDDVIW